VKQKKFGAHGVDVSVIGQGTWYLDRGDRKAAISALRRGIEAGMTHIDTAEMYGEAEPVIADAIAGLPRDAYWSWGLFDSFILVVPSLDLVATRTGKSWPRQAGGGHYDPLKPFFEPIAAAVKASAPASTAPLPPSPVIAEIQWAPKASILHLAKGSDNWPLTWADDDAQYTSYGDGYGFEPHVEKKLGMGFARITGGPGNFRATNLRSDAERTGGGAKSAKASGILMVNGVLYLWVRNVGNAQLLSSEDHGKTWQWGFKIETAFGSPAFLNFGRNYAGAPDGFVYTYSQNGPSAYESDNGITLARVSKDRIRDRNAWQFYEGLDVAGRPIWTSDITRRSDIFSYPANCGRIDVVYDAGLRRYLMALAYNHEGGWGLFDAPEPWGPWTTVLHRQWDVEATHGYRLPSKWISTDGLSLILVFSGLKPNDAFCTRALKLTK